MMMQVLRPLDIPEERRQELLAKLACGEDVGPGCIICGEEDARTNCGGLLCADCV